MTTLNTPAPEIGRDRYGRPLVIPPAGGKPIAYTRCTTYIDVIEDKFNLQKWMQRQVAVGLSLRPDLALSVMANRDNKTELDRICTAAREAAGSSAAATTGTTVHGLTELIDRGLPVPDHLPPAIVASLEKYQEATAALKATHIEQFTVQDPLQIGGTPDRIVAVDGEPGRFIADIKTGSIEWGAFKIAMQMAVYARSKVYDIATGDRSDHGADITKALIIHLPAVTDPAEARCDLHWIDIETGWQGVLVARDVRRERKHSFNQLTTPFGGDHQSAHQASKAARASEKAAAAAPQTVADRIKACKSADDVKAVWVTYASEWSDELTEAAKAHIASLTAA